LLQTSSFVCSIYFQCGFVSFFNFFLLNIMKKQIISVALIPASLAGFAQGLHNNGAAITITQK